MQTRLPTANASEFLCAMGHVLVDSVRMLGRYAASFPSPKDKGKV